MLGSTGHSQTRSCESGPNCLFEGEQYSYLLYIQRRLDLRDCLVDVPGKTIQVYRLSDWACHLAMAMLQKTTWPTKM